MKEFFNRDRYQNKKISGLDNKPTLEKRNEVTKKYTKVPRSMVKSFYTEKGSEYRFLGNGKSVRFKRATMEQMKHMSAIVFIPDYDIIQSNAPESFRKMFGNEREYVAKLLEYIHIKGRRIYIFDKNGKKLETNKEIEENMNNRNVFISFVSNGKQDFALPVAFDPTVGYYTYDISISYNEDGTHNRRKHIGNRVSRINLK